MNNTRHFNRFAAYALAAFLSGTAPTLLADSPDSPIQGGYGMGPGMMGGYGMGMGMGMMGGYGMGQGMMGGYWGAELGLTDAQQSKINQIQDETRKTHWALMNAMMDQRAKLRDLYLAPKRDQAAIDQAYKTFGILRQEMYDSSVAAQKRMEAVLTPEQQEKLRQYWRGGWTP